MAVKAVEESPLKRLPHNDNGDQFCGKLIQVRQT